MKKLILLGFALITISASAQSQFKKGDLVIVKRRGALNPKPDMTYVLDTIMVRKHTKQIFWHAFTNDGDPKGVDWLPDGSIILYKKKL